MSNVPVLKIQMPEYAIKVFTDDGKPTPYYRWGKAIPIKYEENKPNFENISNKVLKLLRVHFDKERIGLRLLSSNDHRDKSRQELIEIIKDIGHDRYDPQRKGDRYENIENRSIDIFALELELGNQEEEQRVKYALESFYYYPIINKRSPIKVDIGIIYDLEKIESVPHRYHGREDELKTDGYVFKYPDKKRESLKGIIEIA